MTVFQEIRLPETATPAGYVALIDALYEHRVKLVLSAAAPPDRLYPEGDAAFEFRRTASRLIEMQSVTYLSQPHAERG